MSLLIKSLNSRAILLCENLVSPLRVLTAEKMMLIELMRILVRFVISTLACVDIWRTFNLEAISS
jgi:hypothetical protein